MTKEEFGNLNLDDKIKIIEPNFTIVGQIKMIGDWDENEYHIQIIESNVKHILPIGEIFKIDNEVFEKTKIYILNSKPKKLYKPWG